MLKSIHCCSVQHHIHQDELHLNSVAKSVISNLRNDDKWTRVGFYSKLNNEKNFPVQIWALAKI